MSHAQVLAPVFVLIALTFGLLVATGRARVGALRAGEVRMKDVALGQNAWPPRVSQFSRAFQNQLELPVVFYVLVALVLVTKTESPVFVTLEWLFVGCRLAHAAIHVTYNDVQQRFAAYVAGLATLAAMWIWFAARVFAG